MVGSLKLEGSTEARTIVEGIFDEHRPRRFVSGGAKGTDTIAEAVADERGVPKQIYLPEQKGWPYYKKRDLLIAADCECLVRVYSGMSRTYGSGFTANEAERRGVRVWRIKVGEGPARA